MEILNDNISMMNINKTCWLNINENTFCKIFLSYKTKGACHVMSKLRENQGFFCCTQ